MKRLILIALLFASCNKQFKEVVKRGPDCSVRTIPNMRIAQYNPEIASVSALTPYVTVYMEYDNALLSRVFGGDTVSTWSYIRQHQAYIKAQYLADSINLKFITKLWTTQDPYNSTSIDGQLTQFGARMDTIKPKADIYFLCQRRNGGGGIAYVATLCTNVHRWKTGVATVSGSFAGLPRYAWDVMVACHEMGHIFGCNHTHDCAWNGNNTKIDDCGGSAGYSSGTCAPQPSPANPIGGGTIMSYCHLLSTGINLPLGFGYQPKSLMRSNIFSATCLVSPSDTVTPPKDTCTSYKQYKTLSCAVGQVGTTTQSRTHLCPDSWSAWTTTSSTCKDTATNPCPSPKVITCSITKRTGDVLVNRAGYTNYSYEWYDNGVKTAWNTQSIVNSKLIKGHTYTCIVKSTNKQTATSCYIPCSCSITY